MQHLGIGGQEPGLRHIEVVYRLTSLSADRTGPEELPALGRTHWPIENRLPYGRAFTSDKDRCRA